MAQPSAEITSHCLRRADIWILIKGRKDCEGSGASPGPRRIDSGRTTLYNRPRIPRVYALIGGGVAEWLKAAVC